MKRKTLLAVAVAAMGMVAIAIAAATLEDRWYPTAEGEDGPGLGNEQPPEESAPPEPVDITWIPYLNEIVTVLVLALIAITVIYLIINYREYLPVLLGFAVIIGIMAFILLHGRPEFDHEESDEDGEFFNDSLGGDGGGAPPEGQIDWLPVTAILGILGLILLAAIAMSVRGSGIQVDQPTDKETAAGSGAVAADLGAAAGRAADRIEASEGYENDVYRAWAEMTDLLDLQNPEVATPGDFAAEAVEAGLAPTDVRDLTRLFEAVRYGDRPANDSRERRAVSLLRRIEDRYAETD